MDFFVLILRFLINLFASVGCVFLFLLLFVLVVAWGAVIVDKLMGTDYKKRFLLALAKLGGDSSCS